MTNKAANNKAIMEGTTMSVAVTNLSNGLTGLFSGIKARWAAYKVKRDAEKKTTEAVKLASSNEDMIDLMHHAYRRYVAAHPNLTKEQAWHSWVNQ
jgi:hypothetical protein